MITPDEIQLDRATCEAAPFWIMKAQHTASELGLEQIGFRDEDAVVKYVCLAVARFPLYIAEVERLTADHPVVLGCDKTIGEDIP